MGVSILDPHPNNECVNLDSDEAWFSFIFCGSHIDKLNLHVYDYYTGEEVISSDVEYESTLVMDPKLSLWRGVGNGVRVNTKDFVQNAKMFDSDGEYTWRAELVQNVDFDKDIYPDNMIFEGVLPGDPNFYVSVDNIQNFDYDHYLPLTPSFSTRIKPPYYMDFLDSNLQTDYYDIPVTYDEVRNKSDGTQYTAVQVDTYTSVSQNTKAIQRPAVGTEVFIHKKEYFGACKMYGYGTENGVYIDSNISTLNVSDDSNEVFEGCYIKVGKKFYKILSYNKKLGLLQCQNGYELRAMPAGTHYAIYTSQFWTPYYYFRVHSMPKLIMGAEFHERRRLKEEEYDIYTNCLENTFNGILFKAYLAGDSHSAVKYHYWEIWDETNLVYKTDKVYSQDMDCEVFVPFGHTYTGKLTVITQDGITVRGNTSYYLPLSPKENNDRFWLAAQLNPFGGVELAWRYRYPYDRSSFIRATDYEVFRVDQTTKETKYLGKVDCSPIKITGAKPALTGANWYLFDKDSNFSLKTPKGAKINTYLVGGGCDGGGWTPTPNDTNKSLAAPQSGGSGGCFSANSFKSDGVIQCEAKIGERNDPMGTTLTVDQHTYSCNDSGCSQRGGVLGSNMTQGSGTSVIYGAAENGEDGFSTPYGIVGSSGGGGAACGGNKTGANGAANEIAVEGIVPKYSKGNWVLIDRDSMAGKDGFILHVPTGSTVRMTLVGGGSDGGYFEHYPINPSWDVNSARYIKGGGGGYVLQKDLTITASQVLCLAAIADVNDNSGTTIEIGGGGSYSCNDSDSLKTYETAAAQTTKIKNDFGQIVETYKPGEAGMDGVHTAYGYVGSSGGGGASCNQYEIMPGGMGGTGAGDCGKISSKLKGGSVTGGSNATTYGSGGGGGTFIEYDYHTEGEYKIMPPGKGMPGCIIFEVLSVPEAECPDPGEGGIGAGDGGMPGNNGDNATRYGGGGGGAGYYAYDSDGNVDYGASGAGKGGCVIIEIDLSEVDDDDPDNQVYVVDWTAQSDKTYRYWVTGCNWESAYYPTRHPPTDMIECTAVVEITPHFEDFYLYFLNNADVLLESNYSLENYDVPLIEPMGRYIDSRNNLYTMVKRHMHTLSVLRDGKAYCRRHTWKIEGNVEIGDITHNITKNINPLYAKMPAVTIEPTDFDSFSLKFLFGYIECEESGGDFVFDDQYMFELWKKCVAEMETVMIKDPKGNIWTGSITNHTYKVEYDTDGMPYSITINFTQTRTEPNTLVLITDEHNKYLRTVTTNYLK